MPRRGRPALPHDDDGDTAQDFPRIARDVGRRHFLRGDGGGGILGDD